MRALATGGIPCVIVIEGNGARPSHRGGGIRESEMMYTLNTTEVHAVAYRICSYYSNSMKSGNPHSGIYECETSNTLDCVNCGAPVSNQGGWQSLKYGINNHPNDSRVTLTTDKFHTLSSRMGTGGGNVHMAMDEYIVRRITPMECERLQGFPDGWTDIGEWVNSKGQKKQTLDSYRYKALGNSIAIPQHYWYLSKMKEYLPEGATLGSLFDGIGGFPLAWEEIYGTGTARWASEIEEFPIAVTKARFPEDDE